MLGAESGQLGNFFICFAVFFLLGLLFDFANLLSFLSNKNYYVRCFFYFVASSVCMIVLELLSLRLCNGTIRWYVCLGALLGISLQRFLLAKPIEKTFNACYNVFNKVCNWIKKKQIKKKDKKSAPKC